MRTKANLSGHPIHPMIVAYPIAFYTTALVAFVVYNYVNTNTFWYKLGYFSTLAGVATAILAAIPGLIDWATAIPSGTPAKARGLLHMSLNVATLLLFIISAFMQRGTWDNVPLHVGAPLWLSLIGVGLTMAAGYQGWEMIATHKMGVNLTPEQERLEPTQEPVDSLHRGTPLRPSRV
jgi:uncharacterized membrane protein